MVFCCTRPWLLHSYWGLCFWSGIQRANSHQPPTPSNLLSMGPRLASLSVYLNYSFSLSLPHLLSICQYPPFFSPSIFSYSLSLPPSLFLHHSVPPSLPDPPLSPSPLVMVMYGNSLALYQPTSDAHRWQDLLNISLLTLPTPPNDKRKRRRIFPPFISLLAAET